MSTRRSQRIVNRQRIWWEWSLEHNRWQVCYRFSPRLCFLSIRTSEGIRYEEDWAPDQVLIGQELADLDWTTGVEWFSDGSLRGVELFGVRYRYPAWTKEGA